MSQSGHRQARVRWRVGEGGRHGGGLQESLSLRPLVQGQVAAGFFLLGVSSSGSLTLHPSAPPGRSGPSFPTTPTPPAASHQQGLDQAAVELADVAVEVPGLREAALAPAAGVGFLAGMHHSVTAQVV